MRSRKRSRKKFFPWRQLGVLALVGAVAILCGWMINTLLLQGYLWAPAEQQPGPITDAQPDPNPNITEPTDEEKPPANKTAQVSLRSMQFYLTQVGAVGTESGANTLIKDLQEQGNAAAYHFDGQLYRVFAGIFADKAAADALGQMFKSMQIDAFTKEVAWPASKGELTGPAGAYIAVAQPAIAAIEETFLALLGTQGLDQAQVIKLQSSLQTARAALAQVSPSSELTALHSDLLAAGNKLKAAVDAIRQFIETGNDHSRFMSESGLIEFAHLYQKFTASLRALLQ